MAVWVAARWIDRCSIRRRPAEKPPSNDREFRADLSKLVTVGGGYDPHRSVGLTPNAHR